MSNLVLYRKYRPLKFADVINQEHVKTTLMNAIQNGRVGHAYLFTGPRGVGKTTMARLLARAVNCQNRQGPEPCNECAICKQLLENSSLDILEIDAASHTGVDNIREITDHVQYSPTNTKFKVIVIDEVHMLSKGAFNALLKTLEEPPSHAIFVLATTEIHKVPLTIVSRTQRFDFKKASLTDLMQSIQSVAAASGLNITNDALTAIAGAADGSFRDGLSLLDQIINYADGDIDENLTQQVLGLTGTKTLSSFVEELINNESKKAIELISDLVKNGGDIYQFQKDLLEYLRKLLMRKVGIKGDGVLEETEERLQQQAEKIALPKLISIIEAFQKAGSEVKWASIPALPLELAVVEVTEAKASEDVKSKMENVKEDEELESSYTEHSTIPQNDNSVHSGDLSKVQQHWEEILDKVKEYNHSLISSMKLAEPVNLINNELILLFPYKFHKDAIEARKNRIVIDQVIEEVVGLKVMVKPLLNKDWKQNSETKEDPVQSALKIMGGQIED